MRRHTTAPYGTQELLCLSSSGLRQTAIFLYREFFYTTGIQPEETVARLKRETVRLPACLRRALPSGRAETGLLFEYL
jgi:hypothetical protein